MQLLFTLLHFDHKQTLHNIFWVSVAILWYVVSISLNILQTQILQDIFSLVQAAPQIQVYALGSTEKRMPPSLPLRQHVLESYFY